MRNLAEKRRKIYTNRQFSTKYITVDNEKIFLIRYERSRIYLLGTNHIEQKYAAIVQKLIKLLSPEVVGVELCRTRAGFKHLTAGEQDVSRLSKHPAAALQTEFKFQEIPPEWRRSAVNEKLSLMYAYGSIRYAESKTFRVELHKYQEIRTYKLRPPTRIDENTKLGAEIFIPFRNFMWRCDAANSNYLSNSCTRYRILLLDRPVQETYALIADALSDEQKTFIKHYKDNFERIFLEHKMQRKRSVMSKLMSGNSKLRQIFLDQRDAHMAKTMFAALIDEKIRKMFCVIGRAHLKGVLFTLRKLSRIKI